MAHVNIVAPGLVQSWIRKTIKQKLPASTWDQISNQFEVSQSVPTSKDLKVPTAVVHKVTDEVRMGEYKATLLSIRKPNVQVIGGANSAEGKESKPTTKIVSVHYTNQRIPLTLPDDSVMGNEGQFYSMAEATVNMMGDLFVEETDYDCQKAMIDGSDPFLSDAQYWENSEYGSEINHPVDPVLHPNLYYVVSAVVTKNTWNATYATANTTLATAIDTEMGSGDGMTLAVLDKIQLIATRTIVPLGGFGGMNEVAYVLKISDAQWYQLTQEATTGIRDLLKYTESGFDRIFTGYLGVYKNMMIIVDQRAPLYNISGSTAGAFQYITPNGDNRVRVAKGSNTGTAEVAMLMGRGALGQVIVSEMDLIRKSRDYEFVKSICGHRRRGTQRMDLDATVAATSARINETSFIVLTATTSAVV
jgi:Protein of unknown function (DUF4043)